MSEERPIKFNLLNKEELIYEVTVRGAVPETTVERLRAQASRLAKEFPSDEVNEFDGDVEAELKLISNKITELEELLDQKPLPLKRVNRIQALCNHLFHRLSRVVADTEMMRALKDRLDRILLVLINRVDRMTFTFTSSFDFKPVGDGSSTSAEKESVGMVPVVTCERGSSVSSLNLKFSGKDSVQEFIVRIEELCKSRNISKEKLFNSAAELFVGEALYWYRGICDEVENWEELKTVLLEEFLPFNYDHRLLQEIRSRTQGPDESLSAYLSIMRNYFSRLRKPLDEAEKLSIVRFNIRPSYSIPLANVDIQSWADLKRHGRQLEAARQMADCFNEPPRNLPNAVAPDLSYKGKTGRPRCEAVARVVEKFCVRCRVSDHTLRECTAPRSVVCFRCGEKGVTAVTCPKCVPVSRPVAAGRPAAAAAPAGKPVAVVRVERHCERTSAEEWRGWCSYIRNFFKSKPGVEVSDTHVQSKDSQDARPYLEADICGVSCSGLLDSGSEISIVGGAAGDKFTEL